jgi:nucleotide-binding universal stress UspA family protein
MIASWRDFVVFFESGAKQSRRIMKKILVPTDLSPTAELGLKLAVEIAKKSGATICLVNFTKHPYGTTFSVSGDITLKKDPEEDLFTIELLKDTKAKLEELVEKYRADSYSMEIAVVDNEYRNGIDEYLHAEQIDLIVMGTSGEESAKELFTGNHTDQTIKVSRCPVLSVRDGFNKEYLNRMVIGVNVITDNKLADALVSIRELAECFDAEVHLVHISDNAADSMLVLDEYFNQIAQIAALKKYQVRVIQAPDISEGLTSYAREVKAGLIAVIKNHHEGIFRIFSNHFAEKIIREEGRPVVTVKL